MYNVGLLWHKVGLRVKQNKTSNYISLNNTHFDILKPRITI